MAALPPYSTYRTDNRQMMFPQATSHGNILTFTPPGFKQSLNVKFPDSRLAVCEKCKKNFKTRDMCRVRNTHTSAPWTTAYICLTLDESCTDANGKYIDKPMTVRMVQWQPFCVKKPFDPKTPVCAACKKTNRTRSFCRERHKHKQLPWCTVYVLLSALESTDPNTLVAAPSKPLDGEGVKKEENNDNGETDAAAAGNKTDEEDKKVAAAAGDSETNETKVKEEDSGEAETTVEEKKVPATPVAANSDDIHDIAESRTFLAKVSCKETSIHWLELSDFETSEAAAGHAMAAPEMPNYPMNPGVPVQGMDPNHAQYYAHAMGYAAQQHQNALKSHQQYFFQMQQRHHQHYAAQQAAWQAQYNQQSQMQLAQSVPPGSQGQPPPPMSIPPPPPPPPPPPLPPQHQQPPASSPENASAPGQVTAGEAAAQQSKRNRQREEGQTNHTSPPQHQQHPSAVPQQPGQQPPQHPHSHSHPHPPPQMHPQGQQHQWMLYQQMYQAQLPPMPPHPPPFHQPGPPRVMHPPPETGTQPPQQQPEQQQQQQQPPSQQQGQQPPQQQQQQQQQSPPEGNGKASNHESDAKRQRLA